MPKAAIAGGEFEQSLSKKALNKAKFEIENAISEQRKFLKAVRKAVQEGNDPAALIGELLSSDYAKLASGIEAAVKWSKRPTLEVCLDILTASEKIEQTNELSFLHLKSKASGGFRSIHSFEMRRRTAQQMVLRVMQCILRSRSFQFTQRGVPELILSAKSHIHSGKHCYAILDIADHFPSFDGKELATLLPFSHEWVERVVSGRHLKVVVKQGEGDFQVKALSVPVLLSHARRGIPLGSISSPIVAEYSTSFLDWMNTTSRALLNYSDNYMLLAVNASQLEHDIAELIGAVGNLPGGTFRLKLLAYGYLSDGCDFLGHTFLLDQDGLSIVASSTTQQRLLKKLTELSAKATAAHAKGNNLRAMDIVEKQFAVVNGWLSAHAHCDDIAEHNEALPLLIKQNAEPFGFDIAALSNSKSVKFSYVGREYEYF